MVALCSLLDRGPAALAPPTRDPSPDRAPDSLAAGVAQPLRESATRQAAAELSGRHFDAYLSSNRTCEIGMSRATGQTYESAINALDRATRP